MDFITILFILVALVLFVAKVGKSAKSTIPVSPAEDNSHSYDDCMDSQVDACFDVQGSEYFSYENETSDISSGFTKSSNSKKKNGSTEVRNVCENNQSFEFDLRQAVIYNAILHNDFIESRH